ncbi:MAG: EAL domain-containing protein [Gammaproteobacteria bacterium]
MTNKEIFGWSEDFETDFPALTEQYRQLLDWANKLVKLRNAATDAATAVSALNDLREGMLDHFKAEESIWNRHLPGHELTRLQQEAHHGFMERIQGFAEAFEGQTGHSTSGPPLMGELMGELLAYLLGWSASHVLFADRRMALLARGVSSGLDLVAAEAQTERTMEGLDGAFSDWFSRLFSRLYGQQTHAGAVTSAVRDGDAIHLPVSDQEAFLQGLIHSLPDLVWMKDPQGVYLACNRRFEAFFGAKERDIIGRDDFAFMSRDLAEFFREHDRLAVESGGPSVNEEWITFASDGHRELLETTKTPLFDESGDLIGVLGIGHDITRRHQTEEELRLAASVFEHANEGIFITDAAGAIVDVNDTFSKITGYTREEVLGRIPRVLRGGPGEGGLDPSIQSSLQDQGEWRGERWDRTKGGVPYSASFTISVVRDEHGDIERCVGLFFDSTVLKQQRQELERLAHHDALTGLPNRSLLADRLNHAMVHAQRRGTLLAVVYLDLDGFKAVNDTHGHEVGDKLLVKLGKRMQAVLRESDTLARLGGDEFVAVLVDLARHENAAAVLDRLMEAASTPLLVDGKTLAVSASAGVTFYPTDEALDADQLIRQSDQAMYRAKQGGRNRYQLFDAEQDRIVRGWHERLDGIRRAVLGNELVLHYQPKVNMRSGEVLGVEALIRWQHPEEGLLKAEHFLPLIRGQRLGMAIDDWVLDHTIAQLDAWGEQGLSLSISVNIDALQLQQGDLVNTLRQKLRAHPRVEPARLQLEVRETVALDDVEQVAQIISQCRDLGVAFALDDFGTGFSSLTNLKRLPVGMVKIDKRFVGGMFDDSNDLAILNGALGLAGAFHRPVVAEGVETVEHGIRLLQLGCEMAQGYIIAKAMPASEVPGWVEHWSTFSQWRDRAALRQEDHEVLLAALEHRAWMEELSRYLSGGAEAPPELDSAKCRFEQLMALRCEEAETAYDDLCSRHRGLHNRALELVASYESEGQTGQDFKAQLDSLRKQSDELTRGLLEGVS